MNIKEHKQKMEAIERGMKKIEPETKKEMIDMPIKERFPHFGIDLKHLPEAKKWEIGKTYKISLEIKQTGISMREGMENEGYVDFDIKGIKIN